MTRPRLLDLFCGAGGAAMGYHRAGFDVVGVDVEDQPRFPFEFVRADAVTFPFDGFDAIHASPPCHDHSSLGQGNAARWGHWQGTGWMLPATMYRMAGQTRPWIVENVERAELGGHWVTVCGAAMGLRVQTAVGGERWLRRHRRFASNVALLVPPCQCRKGVRKVIGVYGAVGAGPTMRGWKGYTADAEAVMGIDWMKRSELTQAIPPAYTEMLGAQLMAAVERIRADQCPAGPDDQNGDRTGTDLPDGPKGPASDRNPV